MVATWNELFTDSANIQRFPEGDVGRFIQLVEENSEERPLRLWDLCCGAGRHTVAMARAGHQVYASDNSENGIALAKQWLTAEKLRATVAVADMSSCPWPDVSFHGIVSWDALHHNRQTEIQVAVDNACGCLLPNGLLLTTLLSNRADRFGHGTEIERNTFVSNTGREAGIPHHYFDEAGVRVLMKRYDILVLAERVVDYRMQCDDFLRINPFSYTTKWLVLSRRPA